MNPGFRRGDEAWWGAIRLPSLCRQLLILVAAAARQRDTVRIGVWLLL
jgi:hypothetical protein